MQERENILRIFEESRKAIKQGNVTQIKNLSNQTTNTASLTHDPDNIAAAIVIYSLSKILERSNYHILPGWKNFYRIYTSAINDIIDAIKRKDDKTYRDNIELIHNTTQKISGKLRDYVQDVFWKARINKASRIYEHGISMEKTASLLGITLFELASYVGQRETYVQESKLMPLKSRIKLAMDMFE